MRSEATKVCLSCHSPKLTPLSLAPKDFEYGVESSGLFHRCTKCLHICLLPLPSLDQVRGYYHAHYTSFSEKTSFAMKPIFTWYHRSESRRVLKRFPHSRSLLDVGCGEGEFLSELRRRTDWKLKGIDVSAPTKLPSGVSFSEGSFDQQTMTQQSFDLVRMNHTIEHFLHPERALQNAWQVLEPKGYLFGETPNSRCLDFKIFRRFWGGLHFPRHLHIFNRDSLTQLAERNGFRVVSIANCRRTLGWSASLQNVIKEVFCLNPPRTGRYCWYPILIALFLPVTLLQALWDETSVIEFVLQKAEN